jgi:hypothetical protein
MRRSLVMLWCGLLTTNYALTGFAQTDKEVATLKITAHGTNYDVPLFETIKLGTNFKNWEIGEGGRGWIVETAEYRISVSGEMIYDPSINYAIAVADFGAPSSFGFLFSSPIAPTGVPNTVRSSLSGSLGDATGDGVSMTPTSPDSDGDTIIELHTANLSAPSTNMGVDVGTALAFSSGVPDTFPFGTFADGPQAGPGPGPWTSMQVSLNFNLSGNGDLATAIGVSEILPVPEPGTLALAGVALMGAMVGRRRFS